MSSASRTRVLAVGIDAAEPTLVRELIDRGRLPALGGLLERGRWALVDSRGDIGSGAVWPTFFTGSDPSVHQMYSGWSWKPDLMAGGFPDESRLTPFWSRPAERGVSVGVLDVPWVSVSDRSSPGDGFEIAEYGPHDIHYGEMRVSGGSIARSVVSAAPRHPFYEIPYGPGYADDVDGKRRLSAAAVEGARHRGDLAVRLLREVAPELAIMTFNEVHHCTHQLWHTVGDDPLYEGIEAPMVSPDLEQVYREVDRQVGRLVDAAPDAAVIAFSLHGMKPGPGIPMLHEALLEELGYAIPSSWSGLTWRERAAGALGTFKRKAPQPLKRLYHRRLGYATRLRLARGTIVPQHDWSRTRAFALPTDQRGYIRVNLAGREAQGCVPAPEYDAVCDQLVEELSATRDSAGRPLVAEVARMVEDGGEPHPHLPDLIVDWAPAAFARPVRLRVGSSELSSSPIRTDMTGQHSRHGFCILDEALAGVGTHDVLAGSELHRFLLAPLGAGASPA